jgi:hypothetical protein
MAGKKTSKQTPVERDYKSQQKKLYKAQENRLKPTNPNLKISKQLNKMSAEILQLSEKQAEEVKQLTGNQQPENLSELQKAEMRFMRIDGAILEQQYKYAERYSTYASQILLELVRGLNSSSLSDEKMRSLCTQAFQLAEQFRITNESAVPDWMQKTPLKPELLQMRDKWGTELKFLQDAHTNADTEKILNRKSDESSTGNENTESSNGEILTQ